MTSSEVSEALHAVLYRASQPDSARTGEGTEKMLAFAFGHVQMLKNMEPEQRNVALTLMHQQEIEALAVVCMAPDNPASSLAFTVAGLMARDETLLSHQISTKFFEHPNFVSTVVDWLLKDDSNHLMQLLVSQVLHNVVKTCASDQVKKIADNDELLQILFDLARKHIAATEEQHWRLFFVAVDILVLFECASVSKRLEDKGIHDLFFDVLKQHATTVEGEHSMILHRVLSYFLMWAMRTRHAKESETVEPIRERLKGMLKDVRAALPEDAFKDLDKRKQNDTSIPLLVHCIESVFDGNESPALSPHLTIKSRVRNWRRIAQEEKEASGKRGQKEPQLRLQGDKDKKGDEKPVLLDVSDSDSSDDDENNDDRSARRRRKAATETDAKAQSDSPTTSSAVSASPNTEPVGSESDGKAVPANKDTTQTKQGQLTGEEQEFLDDLLITKNEGNTYFRGTMYEDALDLYNEALSKLESQTSPSAALAHQISIEKAKLLGNRSECYLRMNQPQNALDDATASLEYDKHFVKSYFRQAKANRMMGNYNKAIRNLLDLVAFDDKNKAAIDMLTELQREMKTVASQKRKEEANK